MNHIDAAWLAGLLEGEGYFQITKPRPNNPIQVLIRLSMTDKDVVEKAANLLNVPINCKAKTSEKKTIYSISLSRRDDVEKVLLQILPHMGSRRSQKIEECLEVIKERRKLLSETLKEKKVKAANIRWKKTTNIMNKQDFVTHMSENGMTSDSATKMYDLLNERFDGDWKQATEHLKDLHSYLEKHETNVS